MYVTVCMKLVMYVCMYVTVSLTESCTFPCDTSAGQCWLLCTHAWKGSFGCDPPIITP
jgi:hypothetical protein